MSRRVTHCYRDPLAELWLSAAARIGFRVTRTDDAFAHSDGKGGLYLATDEHLDADDCLAQMIFHEICHSLVEGPDAFEREDWGLDNTSDVDTEREHAALRVQALLAERWGLREILAPTTDFRAFYDALGADPLAPHQANSSALARVALQRSRTGPWWPHLDRALEGSSEIIAVASKWAAPSDRPALYRLRKAPLPRHASGLFTRPSSLEEVCGSCAWRDAEGHCVQVDVDVAEAEAACERFERPFDCQDCGACCRGAYHSVTIAEGDAVAARHPQLLIHRENYSELRRLGDHCAALEQEQGRFRCSIYADRPTCCRDFENAGPHCVTARRRLGYSL